MDWLLVAQYAIQYGPLLKTAIDEALSNDDLMTKIAKLTGPFAPLLEQLGSQLFPNAKPELHAVAAVMAAFDPSTTKWLQGSLNLLLTPSPNLVVDGLYGPATRAAVTAYQTQLGLTPDGWAGRLTQAAIDLALGKSQPSALSLPPVAAAAASA
jgi:peptidoglycan hydrolase-like protein with peptidoglycan-binding domain